MTSPLITSYVTGLRRSLPAPVADEAADGLIETYQQHLAAGAGDQQAARTALAEFGDLPMVVGAFTRQAPGRRAARLLLATGPPVGTCWAVALISSRAWTWPLPAAGRFTLGAALLLAVLALIVAATSRRSYRRTRLAILASPVIIAVDATAIAIALTTAPALTGVLLLAVSVSLGRISVVTRTLPHLAAR